MINTSGKLGNLPSEQDEFLPRNGAARPTKGEDQTKTQTLILTRKPVMTKKMMKKTYRTRGNQIP